MTQPPANAGPEDLVLEALALDARRSRRGDEDAVQEAWEVTHRREGLPPEQPGPWIRRVVATIAFGRRRSERRRRLREREAAREGPVPGAAEVFEMESLRREVREAVLELPDPYRETIHLRFFEGLPPRAAARRQGAPVETVRTRTRRALELLRRRLDRTLGRGVWMAGAWRILDARRSAASATLLGGPVVALALLLAAGGGLVFWLGTGDGSGPAAPSRGATVAPPESPPPTAGPPAIATVPFDPASEPRVVPAEEVSEEFPLEPGPADGGFVAHVSDELNGEPVGGARISLFTEPHCALSEAWEPLLVAEADAAGWLRVRTSGLPAKVDWCIVEAEGYAPKAQFGSAPEPRVRLVRGTDVPVEVRDLHDRPIEGVAIDYILGCGHTPSIRRTTTGADGRAVLRGIDPRHGEVWLVKPGFDSTYGSAPQDWIPGEPPVPMRMRPGPVHAGQVLEADGRPAAGVLVGAPHCHRGPWVRTGSDGRFVLAGGGEGATLQVHRTVTAKTPLLVVAAAPPGCDQTLRLPVSGQGPHPERGSETVIVEVREEGTGGLRPGVMVVALRDDGEAIDGGPSGDDGRATLRLTLGRHRILAAAGCGTYGPAIAFTVPSPDAVLPIVTCPAEERILVGFEGLPGGAEVLLVRKGGHRNLSQLLREEKPIPIRDGDRLVALSGDLLQSWDPRSLSRAPGSAARVGVWRPAPGRWFRFLGPEGEPVSALATVERPGDLAAWESGATPAPRGEGSSELFVGAPAPGIFALHVRPERSDLRPVRRMVEFPGQPAATRDIRIPRRTAWQLGIDPADPGHREAVALLRAGGRILRRSLRGAEVDFGWIEPAPGDAVALEWERGFVSGSAEPGSAPVEELSLGGTCVDLELVDPAGAPVLNSALVAGGRHLEAPGGNAALGPFPPGRVEVLAEAPGFRRISAILEVLPATRSRYRVVLPPRD